MISLPVWTIDSKRRGVITWTAGQIAVVEGSLLAEHVTEIKAVLAAPHRHQRTDEGDQGELDRGEFLDLQGANTPDAFLFHANFLPLAGFLPMFGELGTDAGEFEG